jgi:hypothetical protein
MDDKRQTTYDGRETTDDGRQTTDEGQFFTFFVATVAILKFLSLKIMCKHVRQNFWKGSSNVEHFKLFVFFCGFHGNGGHFENSESSLHIYS